MLPTATPIGPHHALTAVFVLAPHAHFPRIITAHFTGLKIAADGFLLLCGLHHVVPLVFHLFFIFSATSPHMALALQASVALLPASVAHLCGWRMTMCVDLRLGRSFPLTLCTVLVGASESGWVYLY